MNNEIRTREVKFTTDNNVIAGMPIVFNAVSEVLWDNESKRKFREVIAPEALSQAFIDTQDIMLNIDHDREKLLARRKNGIGSMNVEYAEDGVRFSTECPDTQLGRDTYCQIKRGEYQAMSFAFMDSQDRDAITWDFQTQDGIPTRTVHKIDRLFDISIVYNPAYSQTSVSARSIDEAQQLNEEERGLKVKVEVEIEKEDDKEKDKECPELHEAVATEQPIVDDQEDGRGCGDKDNRGCGEEKRESENYLELLKPYREKISNI